MEDAGLCLESAKFGASFSETTMRPNPRLAALAATACVFMCGKKSMHLCGSP
jgi:hypothetical protein